VIRSESGHGISMVNLADGKIVRSFGARAAFALATSPDGETIAAGHWTIVTLWRQRDGRRLATLRGVDRYATALAFSHNGRLLAVGNDLGGLQIWDVRRHRRLHAIQLPGLNVSEPVFSRDGRLVAVGTYGSGTVWLIDVRTGRTIDSRQVSGMGCGSAAFSPDGRFLITPSTGGLVTWPYDRGGAVKVFRVGRGLAGR
jgi:WD40 repeat protein